MSPAPRWPGPVNPEPDRRPRPTLADSIMAAIMAGLPGAAGWDDPDRAYMIVTEDSAWVHVDTRRGGTAETVRQFAHRVEGGTVRAAVAALADAKARALAADGDATSAAIFEAWAAELREPAP